MGNTIGQFAQASFAPKGQGANDATQDKLVIFPFGRYGAMQWAPVKNSGLLNNATSVTGSGIDSGGFYTNTINGTFSFPTPPTPTAVGSSKVAVSFTITNQGNGGGTCTFTVAGTLTGPF